MRKKILSLALTLALSLSLVTPALAVSVTEIPMEYASADLYGQPPHFSEGLEAVENADGLYGFIDKTGKQVIPCQYQDVRIFSEGLAAVENANELWGFIDKTGKQVVPCQYWSVNNFSEGLAPVANANELWGLIDKTGKQVVSCQYSYVYNFSEGLAAVENTYVLLGFIDKTGKVVVPCQYFETEDFSEGLALVRNTEGLWGVIDKTGKQVVPLRYKEITPFQDGVALARNEAGKAFLLKVDDGKQPPVPSVPEVPTVSGFTDVKVTDFFADAVKWAVDSGVASGTSKDTFSPERTCTTAEILTLLWRANGSPKAAASAAVPAGQYYTDAANWAVEKGLTDGFSADIPATRAATVTYLWKLAGKPAADAAAFTDVDAGAEYAQAVAWAVEELITAGTGADTFSPDKTCTRGEIVTFLYRDLV